MNLFKTALQKGAECKRLSKQEAFALADSITPQTLHEIGQAGLANRRMRFGDNATYIFNMHINSANICIMGCSFCGYAASEKEPHAYIMDEEEILSKVENLNPTEVHIVGGINKIWGYQRNLNLVKALRKRFENLYIKAYTAVEIDFFAKTAKKSPEQILKELTDAGMDAMPGGGAEIFSQRMYLKHWKNKTSPQDWIKIHKTAHLMGIPTNSTMLFGFGETWQERIEHFLILRETQNKTKGFACFIPLAFQPGKNNFIKQGPTPLETLAVLGIARLVLDNIEHIKSYWPMSGLETAAAGLSWGADDMDGTIKEEKIAHFAGSSTPRGLARNTMIQTISTAGFTAIERDGNFKHILKRNQL